MIMENEKLNKETISAFKKGYLDHKNGKNKKTSHNNYDAYLNGWCKYGLIEEPDWNNEENILFLARFNGGK